MIKRNRLLFLCLIFIVMLISAGCSLSSGEKDTGIVLPEDMCLVYEETISPNRDYVQLEEDIVNYTVEIYQDKDNNIFVYAHSNSAFFEGILYEVEYDESITTSDINIEWTTLMGNPEPAEEDQLAVADVSISENGEIFSQRKINFMLNAFEIIGDVL